MRMIQFQVVDADGDECIVGPDTVIRCDESPLLAGPGIGRMEFVGYENIGGLTAQIKQIRDIVELPLVQNIRLVKPPGILLSGLPGTGKTMLARAVANETGVFLQEIDCKQIRSCPYNEALVSLTRAVEEATQKAPSIVLFDDIDAIAAKQDNVRFNFDLSC